MPESKSHKRGKGRAARTEVPISRGRRLDAIRGRYRDSAQQLSQRVRMHQNGDV